uniref:Uncharacterized protein n=1 Tax=viral metagenome TaxID=1070528 RepID=A0A6M3KZD2_9ZZZZ
MSEVVTITHTKVYPLTNHIDPIPFFEAGNKQGDLFSHKMLSYPLRDIVIEKIKAPMMDSLKAGKSFPNLVMVFVTLLITAWRIRKYVGKVTKENSVFKNVHVWLDAIEMVKECHHNQGRDLMVNSAMEIIAAIIEHDHYYRGIAYRIAGFIIKKAEAGEWIVEPDPPQNEFKKCWDENKYMEVIRK